MCKSIKKILIIVQLHKFHFDLNDTKNIGKVSLFYLKNLFN